MSLLKLSRLLQQNLQEDENFNGQSQKFFYLPIFQTMFSIG